MPLTTVAMRWLAALALAAGLAVAALALTGGGTAQSEEAPETASQRFVVPGSVVPPAAVVAANRAELADAVALLRTPSAGDIPATFQAVDELLDLGGARQLGTTPAARRSADTEEAEPTEADVFLVPRADGSQCLLAVYADFGSGQTCALAGDVNAGRFVLTTSIDNVEAEIYGVMPDGVAEVTVALADGSSVDLPVVDNVYLARFEQPTASISWIDAGGQQQTLRATSGA